MQQQEGRDLGVIGGDEARVREDARREVAAPRHPRRRQAVHASTAAGRAVLHPPLRRVAERRRDAADAPDRALRAFVFSALTDAMAGVG